MTESQSEMTLDLSGLLCPLPVFKARKKLQGMKAGAVLHVIATDPMAAIDLPHFCTEQGHQLLKQEKVESALHFWIARSK